VRLAVLIPVYNARTDVERTLASLASDPAPFDIIVVDDGSEPRLVVSETAGIHRTVIIRMPVNRGVAHALNAGLEWLLQRDYQYVARLDAGDMNEPGRLVRQLEYMDQQKHVALVGSWTRHLDEQMQPLYVTRYPATWEAILRRMHYRTAFSHTACMLRTSMLIRTGGYAEHFALGEDYELFWRMASQFPCANIPEVLVTRVESRSSLTHANRLAMARIRLLLQWQHFAWRRLDCWLGVARSIGLLCVPRRVVSTVKRAAGIVG
jgi:glycosyltransferase involved in cell wall biosynthesis